MQNVSFSSVDECLDFLPPDELKILLFLRKIIFSCIPDCTEKLSYNVPYYKRRKNICFLWPGSITWAKVGQKGVRMGFTCGNLLADERNYLEKGERKQVYWKDFTDVREIDVDLIRSFLFQALEIDRMKH